MNIHPMTNAVCGPYSKCVQTFYIDVGLQISAFLLSDRKDNGCHAFPLYYAALL